MSKVMKANDEAPSVLYDLTYKMVSMLVEGAELSMVIHISDKFKASMEFLDDENSSCLRLSMPFKKRINIAELQNVCIGEGMISFSENPLKNLAKNPWVTELNTIIDSSRVYTVMVIKCIAEYAYEMDNYLKTGRVPAEYTKQDVLMPTPKGVYVNACVFSLLPYIMTTETYKELVELFNTIDGPEEASTF